MLRVISQVATEKKNTRLKFCKFQKKTGVASGGVL